MLNGTVVYVREASVDVAEFKRVLQESGLDKVRPVGDERRLAALLRGANLIITARLNTHDRALVGIARCLTDSSWCCYVPDLAVSASAQGYGVGRALLDEIRRQLGPEVSIVLLSYPEAVRFYEKIGMARAPDAFCYQRER
jgi:ribosomal protein S18 acetylase RimI-like enzyme